LKVEEVFGPNNPRVFSITLQKNIFFKNTSKYTSISLFLFVSITKFFSIFKADIFVAKALP
jgi:hypothetical protein